MTHNSSKLPIIIFSLLFFCRSYTNDHHFYSQFDQDRYVYEQFFKNKTDGVFVDIGAHDGIIESNTYFFEKQLGWKGICVEPLPEVFENLKKNRNCICINACIADFNGTGAFLRVSGYSEKLSGLINYYNPRHLQRINKEIQNISGNKETRNELSILRSINFKAIDIHIIDVENNYNDPNIRTFLEKNGYELVARLKIDEIYRKKQQRTTKISPTVLTNPSTNNILNRVQHYLPSNHVILEAGAHIGKDTIKMSHFWPTGSIHAFEPDPKIFNELQKKCTSLSNVTCYPLALADKKGVIQFHSSYSSKPNNFSGSGSLLQPTQEYEKEIGDVTFFGDVIEVQATTLDTWSQEYDINTIDFMWLDMQGYELAALKSGRSLLQSVSVIWTELFFKEGYTGQPLYKELKAFLEEYNFVMIAKDFTEQQIARGRIEGNALFVKNSLL